MTVYGTSMRLQPLVQQIATRLREAARERRLTHNQIALRIRRDRSVVSRALRGERLPSRASALEIARAVGADTEEVIQLWVEADTVRRQGGACAAAGGPPDGLTTHHDLLGALRLLLAGRGLSQREIVARDTSGQLRRSTVGAVLRGERGAKLEVVMAIVAACGVRGDAAAGWEAAWNECSRRDLRERHARRDKAYSWIQWRQRQTKSPVERQHSRRVGR